MGNELPFKVDRLQSVSLTEQIVRGIQGCVWNGTIKPGERLPNIKAMSAQLNASELVVRHAIGRLSAMGVLVARPKSGIIVLDAGSRYWRKHVVFLTRGNSVYALRRDEAYHTACFNAHVRISMVPLPDCEVMQGLPTVRAILDTQTVDLVVIQGMASNIVSELGNRGIRFMHFCDSSPSKLAWGRVEFDIREAYTDMAKHFLACGAQEVAVVYARNNQNTQLEDSFTTAGLRSRVIIPRTDAENSPEGHEQAGYEATKEMLSRKQAKHLYYYDEYVARGGIAALTEAGCAIPGEVQFACHSNKGNKPMFRMPLSIVEADPAEHGRVMAEATFAALESSKPLKQPFPLKMRFVVGETTREKR